MVVDDKAPAVNKVRLHSCLGAGTLVLDVAGGSVNDGAEVILWTPTGAKNQTWIIDENGNTLAPDLVRIIVGHSGRMLARDADNACMVDTWPGGYTPNLRWRIVNEGDGQISIESANGDGLVLAVADGVGEPGKRIIVYKRVMDGKRLHASQRFWLEGA